MTRLKGKVISRPLQSYKVEQYAWHKALGIWRIYQENLDAGKVSNIPLREMRELVVQTNLSGIINDQLYEGTGYIPLKYSQWQAAIDNGEVDSNKTVEFEIVYMNGGYSNTGTPPSKMAKIIPAKKKVYTEEEMEWKCKLAFTYGLEFPMKGKTFEDFKNLHLK